MQPHRNIIFHFREHSHVYHGIIRPPQGCPLCHQHGAPIELFCDSFPDADLRQHIAVFYQCSHCSGIFLNLHRCDLQEEIHDFTFRARLLYTVPKHPEEVAFPSEISAMSPDFVKIYNQALAAEDLGLTDIAGIGYRKALEFLIKDYCILLSPQNAHAIQGAHLGHCISKWLTNPVQKTIAEAATQLGNDETHYLRKHTDWNLSDMKYFIDSFIGSLRLSHAHEEASKLLTNLPR